MKGVSELLAKLIAGDRPLSALLREALTISSLHRDSELIAWIDVELNGYASDASLPTYRMVSGELRAQDRFQRWLPVLTNDPNLLMMSTAGIATSVPELESLVDELLFSPISGEHAAMIQELILPGFSRPSVFFGKGQKQRIISGAINYLLSKLLALNDDAKSDHLDTPAAQRVDAAAVENPRVGELCMHVFIGSSKEGHEEATALQVNLEKRPGLEVTVWSQGFFELSRTSIESLDRSLGEYDAAVFVVTPDDISEVRGETKFSPRDNVILELGISIGRLGRNRTFIVSPKGPSLLPSDLLGVAVALYDSSRQSLIAALGSASTEVFNALRKVPMKQMLHAAQHPTGTPNETKPTPTFSDAEALALLEHATGNGKIRLDQPVIFDDADRLLSLASGTTKRLIRKAAERWDYQVRHEGENLISFQRIERNRSDPWRSI